jgi:hypothetical protein
MNLPKWGLSIIIWKKCFEFFLAPADLGDGADELHDKYGTVLEKFADGL